MKETIFHVSLHELCQSEEFTEEIVIEAVEYGIVEPIAGGASPEWVFDTAGAYWLKKSVRLYYDFEIDWVAIALLVDLLREKETLQRRNECLEQRLRKLG